MNNDLITEQILRAAYKVHSALGPGLLEAVYQSCLAYESKKEGFLVEIEKPLPLIYEEVKLDCGYRLDLLVENSVIVELKMVKNFTDVHVAQMLTYLRLANKKVGQLINFYTKSLKHGIKPLSL
jgi:GxxExxY protein